MKDVLRDMVIVREAPINTRNNRYGFSVSAETKSGKDLWYQKGKWTLNPDSTLSGYSNMYSPCRTLKAFYRHCRKHAKDEEHIVFTWNNRYMGQQVTCTKISNEKHIEDT